MKLVCHEKHLTIETETVQDVAYINALRGADRAMEVYFVDGYNGDGIDTRFLYVRKPSVPPSPVEQGSVESKPVE